VACSCASFDEDFVVGYKIQRVYTRTDWAPLGTGPRTTFRVVSPCCWPCGKIL